MDGDTVITFDSVWKKFRRGERHDSLRDLIPAAVKRLVGRRSGPELRDQEFWALQDVSFVVKRGEAVGIIGPNGAGKSTALKLLTRIMKPTRGRCQVIGRVGALIEVASGFHPDLTGRENVFLQGAIMGMPRSMWPGASPTSSRFQASNRSSTHPSSGTARGCRLVSGLRSPRTWILTSCSLTRSSA